MRQKHKYHKDVHRNYITD